MVVSVFHCSLFMYSKSLVTVQVKQEAQRQADTEKDRYTEGDNT